MSGARILLLVDCYLPSIKSSAKLVHDLAIEFHRRGHDVIVAAPDDTIDRICDIREEEGITVIRVRTGAIKGAGLVRRFVNEWRLSSVMWAAAKDYFRDHPCEMILFYSPTIFFSSLVKRLKRAWNCRTYLILRDIFPQWAVDAGVLKRGSAPHRFLRRAELRQYAVADLIGVQSPANLDYFQNADVRNAAGTTPLEVLFNWTATEQVQDATTLRQKLKLDDKTVFFYGGNIGVAQDMDNVIRLAESMRDQCGAHFLLVGDGSETQRLMELVDSRKLTNVTIHPAVSQQEYLAIVGEFDVGLITLDHRLRTHNIPGKLLSYLRQGLPILASINPDNDLRQVIDDAEAGLVCLNGEDHQFTANAMRLFEDKEMRRHMGRNARQLLEQMFSVEIAADRILAHLD